MKRGVAVFVLAIGMAIIPISWSVASSATTVQTIESELQNVCVSTGYGCTLGGYGPSVSTSSWAWAHYGGTQLASETEPHNCTLYAAWMLEENGLSADPGDWGDAAQWANETYFPITSTPNVGSIVVYPALASGLGHVGFVAGIRDSGTQVLVISDNYPVRGGTGTTSAGWVSTGLSTDYIHVAVVEDNFRNGMIIRESSGVSWALTDGSAAPIVNGGTFICGRYRNAMPTEAIQKFYLSADLAADFSCTFNHTVVEVQGSGNYWILGTQAGEIPTDPYSLAYYVAHSLAGAISMPAPTFRSVFNVSFEAPAEILVSDLPSDSVISTQGTYLPKNTWAVLSGEKQLIPDIWDDVCWKDKAHYGVVVLTQSQLNDIPSSNSPGNCVVGPAVVHSSNGAIYYVDSANRLHWIPDESTVEALEVAMTSAVASTAGVPDQGIVDLGTWPSADVSSFQSGANLPSVLDWRALTNSIVEYGSASYLVDSSGVSHSIPSVADFICRNIAQGLRVSLSNISSSQISSLVPGTSDTCSIGPAVLSESDGPNSYFVNSSNVRYSIPDIPTYWLLSDQASTHYSWQSATVTALPLGGSYGDPMVNKIIEGPSPNDNYYFVGTNLQKYWIPSSTVLACLEGSEHNVPFFGQVQLNVVNNYPNASNWAAC